MNQEKLDSIFKSDVQKINNLSRKKVSEIAWRIKHRVEMALFFGGSISSYEIGKIIQNILGETAFNPLFIAVVASVFILSNQKDFKSTKLYYLKFIKFLRDNPSVEEIKEKLIKFFQKSQTFEGYCTEQGLYLAIRDVFGKKSPEMRIFKELQKEHSKNKIPNF